MNFLELAQKRWSVRSFSPKPVEQEKIDKIMRAAMLAPTAVNNQPQKIYIIKSKEALEKINSTSPCIYGAPLVFLVCADTNCSWKSPFVPDYDSGEMDASIVCTHMMLEAEELELGSVWVLYFDREKTRKAFSLPEHIKPICLLPVGYRAADAAPAAGKHDVFRDMADICTEL